jgi:two-component system sensor kinase FixL
VARLVLSYLGAYVVADWVSYLYPLAPFAITPWNPPPGLSLALLLLCGLRYAPAVLVAVLTADAVVRDVPGPPWAMLASALVIAGGYSAVAALLLRALRIDPGLKSLRDLSWLLACVAAGTALIACAYVGVYVLAGQIARSQAADHALRFWIGDMIGVVVTTPLVLVVVARRPIGRSWEVAAQAGAIVLALALVFGVGYPVASPLFYLLFLPLVWIAMRHGFRGAAYAAFATQIGLIAAARVTGHSASSVLEMQFLMLALAVTSLLLGMAVSERREAVERLSEKQEDLARTLRLAAAGEMASALAHELNQPLSAPALPTR